MFLGHFALGVATKRIAPTIPIWVLLLAPQFMDIVFLPLVALGIEGYVPGPYGHDTLTILYSHSLVGALVLAAIAGWIGNRFWRETHGGAILAALSFSHWIIDILVHHADMPLLPGNIGGFPLMGLGLWDFEYAIYATEAAMAVVAFALYLNWARQAGKSARWFVGPALIGLFFAVLIVSDFQRLPPLS